jgi:hypothetical protein
LASGRGGNTRLEKPCVCVCVCFIPIVSIPIHNNKCLYTIETCSFLDHLNQALCINSFIVTYLEKKLLKGETNELYYSPNIT